MLKAIFIVIGGISGMTVFGLNELRMRLNEQNELYKANILWKFILGLGFVSLSLLFSAFFMGD